MTKSQANSEAKKVTAGYIDGLVSDEVLWQQFFGDKSEKDQERLKTAFVKLAEKLSCRKATHD